MLPRVFVSSVMTGFEEHRHSARMGIMKAGGEPVLAEDFPGKVSSPRNACLDGVVSCDVFVVIVGSRGGWVAPSGKLVVEEEYEEARKRRLHVLAFTQDGPRDADAQRLVEKISDYVEGVFRPSYSILHELEMAVEQALTPVISQLKLKEVSQSVIDEKLKNPHHIHNETVLRFVLSPERVEDVIDPVLLESPELKKQLMDIGHKTDVSLFSYECSKKTTVNINDVIIHQSEERYRRDGADEVRLELTTNGMITIDMNLTGRPRPEGREEIFSGMILLEDDIVAAIKKCFAFVNAFYNEKDPFKRYDRFFFNVALGGIGYRTLMSKPPVGGSYPMGNQGDKVVIAFDKLRLINRVDLASPGSEVSAALALFRRRLKN